MTPGLLQQFSTMTCKLVVARQELPEDVLRRRAPHSRECHFWTTARGRVAL